MFLAVCFWQSQITYKRAAREDERSLHACMDIPEGVWDKPVVYVQIQMLNWDKRIKIDGA